MLRLPPLLRHRWLQLAVAASLFLLPLVALPIARSQSIGWQSLALRGQSVGALQAVVSEAGAILYVQTSGNLLRSLDGGSSFVRADVGLPQTPIGRHMIQAWAVTAADAWQLYAIAGPHERTRLYHTLDGGSLWREIGHLPQGEPGSETTRLESDGIAYHVLSLAVAPSDSNQLYLAEPRRAWHSTDGGRTWVAGAMWPPELQDATTMLLAIDGHQPLNLFATAGNGVWLSEDGAASWQRAGDLPPMAEIASLTTAKDRGGWLYAGGRSLVYRSTDGGTTWHATALPGADGLIAELLVDPVVGETVYAADAARRTFRTDDGGGMWRQLDVKPKPFFTGSAGAIGQRQVLVLNPAGRDRLYAAFGDGIWVQAVDPLQPTETSTATATATHTATHTATPTATPTYTPTSTPTPSPTATPSPTPSPSPTPTASPTASAPPTPAAQPTASAPSTPTAQPTPTAPPAPTPTTATLVTPTPIQTAAPTPTAQPTAVATATPSVEPSLPAPTNTPDDGGSTPTPVIQPTATPVPTPEPTRPPR